MFYDSISIRNRHLIPPSKRWDDSRTRAKGSGIRKQVIIERMWLCVPPSIQASMGCISTNAFQLIICIISGVCCLLPLAISPKSYLEGSLLRASLTAQLHRESAIAVVTLIVPLLLDITTDILSSFFTKARDAEVKKKSKLALLNNMEHLVFLCGTVVIPITAFIPSSNDNWAYIYISCRQCQLVLTGGAITISLCRYDEKYWPVRATYLVLVCLLIASTIGAFSNNYLLENPPSNTVQALQSTSYYIFLIAAVIFTFCSLRWLWVTVPKLMPRSDCFSSVVAKHTSKERGTTSDISKQSYLFPVVYVVTSVSICPVLFLLSNIYSNCLNYDIRALFFHNLIFFVYLLLITYGSTRMMKYEIVKGLYALIESKKMYVRYISHELRTPLNSACLGLKLVSDDLECSTETKDVDHFDILSDVKSACRTAVQILDDLLCFDKLESGILEIHKHEVPVMPFISECVSMFTSQAMEAGVTMSVIAPERDLHGESLTPILEGDIVYMDKFKMDQVLRNLISNALKFTPRGGVVSVSASFVPTDSGHVPLGKLPTIVRNKVTAPFGITLPHWIHNCIQSKVGSVDMVTIGPIDIEEGGCDDDCPIIKGKLVIVVTDTGAGISEENQQRLFNEIVQFNPEVLQAGGGSGLGLWITNSLVKMHNGSVRVHSAGEGMGCSFTAEIEMQRRMDLQLHSIPFCFSPGRTLSCRTDNVDSSSLICTLDDRDILDSESKVGDSNLSASSIPAELVVDTIPPLTKVYGSFCKVEACSNSDKGEYDILVVDDSSLNRKMLCRVLRTSGHRCDEAVDGLSAVEKVKVTLVNGERGCYDVILMDFVMPNMDGPTATKVIRDLGYSGLIFGVTGNALDSDMSYFLSHGADRVLAKPFDYKTFELYMKSSKDTCDVLS